MWTYSHSSEIHLKRFLNLVRPPDENNKWIKKFKRNIEKTAELGENVCKDIKLEIPDSHPEVVLSGKNEEITSKQPNSEDVFSEPEVDITLIENAETDLQEKFLEIYRTLLHSPQLLPKFAEKLTINCIEKLTLIILGHDSLDPAFIENFYKDFIPAFLKREYTWVTLDVLVITYKKQPDFFKKYVLLRMLKDMEISNKVLMSFIETLSLDDRLLFFTKILEVELNEVEFLHNLSTIFTLYKDCKSSYIQTCMEKILVENSEHCAKEKTFGKLLLAFLQHQKKYGRLVDSEKFTKCVEAHQTPFKKPCLNIIQEINLI